MILIAILGLVLPGYALARALRVPIAVAAAFPLSALLLTETIIAYTLFGVPIRFATVLAVLVIVSVMSLIVVLRCR